MSNGLTEYEIVEMARGAGGVQLFTPRELGAFHKKAPDIHISMTPDALERFATLCRAPLVAEVERLKKDLSTYDKRIVALSCIAMEDVHELLALQADRDDWKARAEAAEAELAKENGK